MARSAPGSFGKQEARGLMARGGPVHLGVLMRSFYTITDVMTAFLFPTRTSHRPWPFWAYPVLGPKEGALLTPSSLPTRVWRRPLVRDGAGRVEGGPSASVLGTFSRGSTTRRDVSVPGRPDGTLDPCPGCWGGGRLPTTGDLG